MSDSDLDLTGCDREPIHIPGSIQPHGVMLVADRNSLAVSHAAGDVALRLGVTDWRGRALGALIGDTAAGRIGALIQSGTQGGFVGQYALAEGLFDMSAHLSGEHLIVEIEPAVLATPAAAILGALDAAAGTFERAPNLETLCERAAVEFRRLTGFDRVMIYRFLDDEAGAVLAEDRADHLPSFLHHQFPGSDIPRQARALYVRNLVRVIPDIAYTPAPLTPAWTEPAPLDMSDSVLRSVSPIHMQYMRNMGVGASASVSIVRDGVLWGLVACHHSTPRLLPYDVRAACRALAGGLARQIRAKEEAQLYRERLRLRTAEEEIGAGFEREGVTDASLAERLPEIQRLLAADGAAVLRAGCLSTVGVHPPEADVRALAGWLLSRKTGSVVTDSLSAELETADGYADQASGLVGLVISPDEPLVILWFRAEQLQVVNWAGNPHKASEVAPGETLTPRTSFEAWRETVHSRSRAWSLAEIEAANRLRVLVLEARQHHRLRELNLRLTETVNDKEALLAQKEVLLKEANHRIQNSLQLVSSFLGLQARALDDPALRAPLEEARRRLHAVALVHRRLYRADQIETIDLARYIEELIGDMLESMGSEWAGQIALDLSPVLVPTDRAVTLGLILTELVINANKYAYDGAPGPIEVTLEARGAGFKLVVADHGKGKPGKPGKREGFGSRMMAAMVQQLDAQLEQLDNGPGLRTVLTGPVAPT